MFIENRRKSDAFLALAVLAGAGWFAGGRMGILTAGLSLVVTFLFSLWCRKKIGGFTGDTLGASCEIAELVPAMVGAAYLWSMKSI